MKGWLPVVPELALQCCLKPDVVHACNASAWKVEAGGYVQGYPQLHSELEVELAKTLSQSKYFPGDILKRGLLSFVLCVCMSCCMYVCTP